MPRSLYARLAVVLLGLLAAVGALLVFVSVTTTEMYRQEVNQKLNRTLAELIVSEKTLMIGREANDAALKDVFSLLMAINPAIEVYLLDPSGKVLSYSAEPGRVKRMEVDLAPVTSFLEGAGSYPILGDDPRSAGGRKIFTAARIPRTGPLQGYLYVILGGETYDTLLHKLQGSYILRLGLWVSVVSLLAAAGAGLALFAYLTRRLRRLADAMTAYSKGTAFSLLGLPPERGTADEIGRLTATFRTMAEHIEGQVDTLKSADALRRELVAGVSHDLRTPLATLQGYIETVLMRDASLSADERKRYLETAIKHCEHLGRLVEGLFELAKLESRATELVREPFSISELVQDLLQKYELRGKAAGVVLQTNAGGSIPFVTADIALIGRALENLVENAVRHTPPGGTIHVDLDAGADAVLVTVRDSGTGIPAEDLPRIFDRYYRAGGRADASSGHAGLGLAIVKKIIELHGGGISVQSQPGRGAVFAFSLPLDRPAA